MKLRLLFIVLVTVTAASAQSGLDTLKVYNVHCSYTDTTGDTTNFYNWGGTWTSFFPTEECTEPRDKFRINRDTIMTYIEAEKPFWMMLYNTNEQLLYEGIHYKDCLVGPFIVYHPSGKVKTRGQYSGVKIHNGKYKITDCEGKPTGTWISYNLIGHIVNTVKY